MVTPVSSARWRPPPADEWNSNQVSWVIMDLTKKRRGEVGRWKTPQTVTGLKGVRDINVGGQAADERDSQ